MEKHTRKISHFLSPEQKKPHNRQFSKDELLKRFNEEDQKIKEKQEKLDEKYKELEFQECTFYPNF